VIVDNVIIRVRKDVVKDFSLEQNILAIES